MRRLLFGVFLFACLSPAFGEPPPDQPREVTQGKVAVALDTGAHTTAILALAFTPDGKQLITSQYEDVRVWSVTTGDLERMWRFPTRVDHLAVSPDGKLVAAARWLNGPNSIWLLNLQTGGARAVRDVPCGQYECAALAFSPDGERLAWTTWYNAGVLEVKTGRHTHVTPRFEGDSTGVAFSKDGNQLLVTRFKPREFLVYDLAAPDGKKLPLEMKRRFTLETAGDPHSVVRWAPDGSRFVTWDRYAREAELYLWSAEGKKPRTLAVKDFPTPGFLQFLGPDKVVLAGVDAHSKLRSCLVNLTTGKAERSFEMGYPRRDPIGFACTADGRFLAVTSGPGFQVTVYDLEAKKWYRRLGKEYLRPINLSWGPDGRSIAWGLEGKPWTGKTLEENLAGGLDLDSLKPLLPGDFKKGYRAWNYGQPQGWRAVLEQANDRKDKKRGLTFIRDGKRIETEMDGELRNWTFFKDADGNPRVILCSGWGDGHFAVYDALTGKHVTDTVGRGLIDNLVVSPDARYLLVSTGGQVLDVYRIEGKPAHLLSILVAGADWVAWTPQGYYAATPSGEKLVGWSFKTDNFTPLTFYPLERYRKVLYRPDVIRLVLKEGSVEGAMKATKARAVVIEDILPPAVVLQAPKEVKVGGETKLQVEASAMPGSKGQPVESLRLLLDGRAHPDVKPVAIKADDAAKAVWTIDPLPGQHELKVLARCPDISGVSAARVLAEPLPDKDKPLLYRVCVGVNDYDQKGLALGSAKQDAEAVFDALEKDCTGPNNRFRAAAGLKLLDKDATRNAVLEALKGAQKAGVKPGDLVVVFFGGHGVVQREKDEKGELKNEFYLLTREADTGKPLAGQSLSGADLRAAFGELPCSVLLLMDACHSAAGIKALKPATDDLTRSLTDDQVAVTVLAAAMGYETAGEHPGHGLFTQALLEGLKAGAGVPFDPHDHELYVHHLYSYVFGEVRRASEGKQNPFLNMPWTVPPLALREVPEKAAGPK
jgi:WD40 repeat protein